METIATRPAYAFLFLVLALHLTVGATLQLSNPAFGVFFDELFFFAALTWLFVAAMNYRPREFLALRLPPAGTMLAAAGTALAGFFVAGAINALNRALVGPEIADRFDITGLFDVRSPWEGALLVVGVSVLAPIGEELVFRGYLHRVLGARYGAKAAILVTSALFAVIHFNPASVLALFALGLIFALLREWSGSLWPAILAHALQNGTSTALVMSGFAEESPDELPLGQAALLLAFTLPFLVLALSALRRRPAAEPEALPIDPEADHRFRPSRVAKPAAAVAVVAAMSVGLLFAVDGDRALERLERAAGRPAPVDPAPLPD